MKKLLAILILLSMILAFTVSCRSSDKNNKENKQDAENNEKVEVKEDPEPEVRIFSQINSESDISKGDSSFVSTESLGLYTDKVYRVFDDLKDKTKTFSGFEGEFVYYRSRCMLSGVMPGEYGSFYSVYDIYKNKNDPREEVDLLHGTNTIVSYSNIDTSGSLEEKDDNKLKETARKFLLNTMNEEKFNEFTFVNCETSLAPRFHGISYVKYINGYATDEAVFIMVSPSGETVMGYNGYNVGKYDTLESTISKEALDTAYDALKEKIASRDGTATVIHDPRIITNTEGKVFLQINYEYKDLKGNVSGETIVTNVF